jgi:hypothetical protein
MAVWGGVGDILADMTTEQIAKQLVALCSEGKFHEAISTLYADDVVSVEAFPMPDGNTTMTGLAAVLGKAQWWSENHEVHSASVEGPLVSHKHFTVRFLMEVTQKPTGMKMKLDELAVYEVKDGKIVREQFFYAM